MSTTLTADMQQDSLQTLVPGRVLRTIEHFALAHVALVLLGALAVAIQTAANDAPSVWFLNSVLAATGGALCFFAVTVAIRFGAGLPGEIVSSSGAMAVLLLVTLTLAMPALAYAHRAGFEAGFRAIFGLVSIGFMAASIGFLVTRVTVVILWILVEFPIRVLRMVDKTEPGPWAKRIVRTQPNGHGLGKPAQSTEGAPATQQASNPYDGEDDPLNWEIPNETLASMAGMVEFKTELMQDIGRFRNYANNGGPVADRNGILFYGPPGNGKSMFARAIAGELGLPFKRLGVQDLNSQWVNGSAQRIEACFKRAKARPCVLFLDEFDAIAASRGKGGSHAEDTKIVNALLAEIDSARRYPIVLIAATNFLQNVDAAIARDGRFDFRKEIPWPDKEARFGILQGLSKKMGLRALDTELAKVADLWVRRSPAFMESVVRRLRDSHGQKLLMVTEFKEAAQATSRRDSALPKEGPSVSELILTAPVRECVKNLMYRLRNWETLEAKGAEPPRGLVLYGPPGTGKTQLVRAIARELRVWHVFEVDTPAVLRDPSKFDEIVNLASDHRPAIVFLDEADELLKDRAYSGAESATNAILKQMDGIMGKVPEVIFIAATNRVETLDAAVMRGGRFSEHLYMGKLAGTDLSTLVDSELAKRPNGHYSIEVKGEAVAAWLGESAPADVVAMLRRATGYTLSENGERKVEMADLHRAHEASNGWRTG